MSEIMLVLPAARPFARRFSGSADIGRPFYCKERSASQIDAQVAAFVCRYEAAQLGDAAIDRCYIYDTD